MSNFHTRFATWCRLGASAARLQLSARGGAVTVMLLGACTADAPTPPRLTDAAPVLQRAGNDEPKTHRRYGAPQRVGRGTARAYVVLDAKHGESPLELGLALSARALDGLPSDMMSYVLRLPRGSPPPYQFAVLDWNPHGHEPAGVYTSPHFDFHFYMISPAERSSIVPSDPQFAAKANNLPTGDAVPPFYVVLAPPMAPPVSVAVPAMGVHWADVRSPELQNIFGHPDAYQPFTKTFIYGSWDGRFTFYEPMATRDYLLSKPDVVTDIAVPQRYAEPGYYPTAYRVTYDARRKEYRVALARLVARS